MLALGFPDLAARDVLCAFSWQARTTKSPTLGLLLDMRDLCTEIATAYAHFTAKLRGLMRQVQNPNVHGLDKDMGFRVEADRTRRAA